MSATDRIAEYLVQRLHAGNTRPVIATNHLYSKKTDQPLTVADLEQVLETNRILSQQAAEYEASLAANIREAQRQAWAAAIDYALDPGDAQHFHPDNPYRD